MADVDVRPLNVKAVQLILLSLVFASICVAQSAWYDGDKIAPDRPNQKAKGGFGAQLQLTNDPSFFTKWATPETPNLVMARFAAIGDRVYSVLLFIGAGKNADGESFVSFHGRVIGPDGRPIQEFKDIRVIHGLNRARDYDIGLSEGYVLASFSNESAKGVYTFELTVTDHVKNVDLKLEQKTELK
jgi:hypothetical protein